MARCGDGPASGGRRRRMRPFQRGRTGGGRPRIAQRVAAGGQPVSGTATGPKVASIKAGEPSTLFAIISAGGTGPQARVDLTVDSRGMISAPAFNPAVTA